MKELEDGAVEGGRHVLDMARAFDVLAYLFKAMYSFTSLIIYNSIAVATPIRHLMLDH